MKRPLLPRFVGIHTTLLLIFAMLCATSVAWCSGPQNPKMTKCWMPEKSGYSGANYGLCRSVCRKHYRLRHKVWSGIFPFEGGLIPDPHFLCSEDDVVSRPVASLLGDENSHYSIVDINPFFDDKSSEIVLIIRSQLDTFEYSLRFPHHKGVRAILADPSLPPAKLFPYKGSLAVLVNFFGPVKGFYVVPFPPRAGTTLELIPAASPEFETIAASFQSVRQESGVKERFCGSTNDFIWFYEKYGGPCSKQSHTTSEINQQFSSFWLKD